MPFEMIKNTVQVKANEETIQTLKSIQTPKVKVPLLEENWF